jgi:hypothetical protein
LTKPVIVEVLGGGDSDGLFVDSRSKERAVAEQALNFYRMTAGGELGRSMVGMSAGNVLRLLRGERFSPEKMGGQPHFYTVVERIEEPNEMLLRLHYTAGRTKPVAQDDGSKPGWVNTAIRRFVTAGYPDININHIIEFWIGQDLRNKAATTIEKLLFEENYRSGPLDERCKTLVCDVEGREKVKADYSIAEDVIHFTPKAANT